MRFFFRKKDEARKSSNRPEHMISMLTRDYRKFISRDVAIKIWLPESVEKKMEEIATLFDCSVSDLIRQILFVHLYGRYDFLGLVEREDPKRLKASGDTGQREYGVRYSFPNIAAALNRPDDIKSIAGFKVWVPDKMKWHLTKLAEQHRMSMSAYAREVIMTHLLGNVPSDRDVFSEVPPLEAEES